MSEEEFEAMNREIRRQGEKFADDLGVTGTLRGIVVTSFSAGAHSGQIIMRKYNNLTLRK